MVEYASFLVIFVRWGRSRLSSAPALRPYNTNFDLEFLSKKRQKINFEKKNIKIKYIVF